MRNSRFFVKFLYLFCLLLCRKAVAQPCGVAQSLSSIQQSQIAGITPLLDTALKYEDLFHIDSLSAELKAVFGMQAGVPDQVESYQVLDTTTQWLDLNSSILLSRLLVQADSLVYADLWKTTRGMSPPLYQPHSLFLRAGAEIAVGLLKIADKETDLSRKTLYQSWAIRALDSLAGMQLPNGAFPFPDLRTYNDPVFSPIIQNFLNQCGSDSVNVLQGGWIVDDKGTGEFKFDAGIIGNAYYEAYLYTGLVQYKNIALSVADYMKPLAFNLNYNYNTFPSLVLGRAYQLSNDTTYLNRSLTTLRYALVPGQIENGRWMDGHNANSSYHSLMIQNMCPTVPLIPSGSMYEVALDSMVYKAIKNQVDYSYTCGFATGYRWLLKAWQLPPPEISVGLHDSITKLIGRHINQSALNGKFLNVPTMGEYLELLSITASAPDKSESETVHIFPNPCADDVLNIRTGFVPEKNLHLIFSDNNGRCIQHFNLPLGESGNWAVDISRLNAGIYFMTLLSDKEMPVVRKLVITR